MSYPILAFLKRSIKYWVFFIVMILSFQNCGSGNFLGSKNDQSSESANSLEANGDSYDGKLTLSAPPTVSPNQPVKVEVLGGQPPYQLSSSSQTGVFVEISLGVYQFQIDNSEQSSQILLQVTDSMGSVATKAIRVLGNNRWFFEKPEKVTSGPNNSVLFIDNQKYLYHLDEKGNDIFIKEAKDFGLIGENLVGLAMQESLNQVAIVSSSSSLSHLTTYSLSTKRLSRIPLHLECSYWGPLASSPKGELALNCESNDRIYIYQNGLVKGKFDTPKSSLNPGSVLTSLHIIEDNKIFLSFNKSEIVIVDFSGKVLKAFSMVGVNDKDRIDIVDTAIAENGHIFALNKSVSQLVELDADGVTVIKRTINGVEFGNIDSPDSIDILGSGQIVVADDFRNSLVFYNSVTELSHKFGSSAYSKGSFLFPTAVEYDANGSLYVLDSGNKRLQIFDEVTNKLEVFNSREWTGGPWWGAHSFRLKQNGGILVTNTGRQIVQELNITNPLVYREISTVKGLDLKSPSGVEKSTDGTIYLADSNNSRLIVCPPLLGCSSVGEYGRLGGQFAFPAGLRIHNGLLYVADRNNNRIQVLNLKGEFIEEYRFLDIRGLRSPSDLFVYGDGNLLVADTANNRIVRRLSNGKEEVIFAGPVTGRDLNQPSGISRHSNGDIAFSDTENHRIIIFNETSLETQVEE